MRLVVLSLRRHPLLLGLLVLRWLPLLLAVLAIGSEVRPALSSLRPEITPILGLALDARCDKRFVAADLGLLHLSVLAVLLVALLIPPLDGALVLDIGLPRHAFGVHLA